MSGTRIPDAELIRDMNANANDAVIFPLFLAERGCSHAEFLSALNRRLDTFPYPTQLNVIGFEHFGGMSTLTIDDLRNRLGGLFNKGFTEIHFILGKSPQPNIDKLGELLQNLSLTNTAIFFNTDSEADFLVKFANMFKPATAASALEPFPLYKARTVSVTESSAPTPSHPTPPTPSRKRKQPDVVEQDETSSIKRPRPLTAEEKGLVGKLSFKIEFKALCELIKKRSSIKGHMGRAKKLLTKELTDYLVNLNDVKVLREILDDSIQQKYDVVLEVLEQNRLVLDYLRSEEVFSKTIRTLIHKAFTSSVVSPIIMNNKVVKDFLNGLSDDEMFAFLDLACANAPVDIFKMLFEYIGKEKLNILEAFYAYERIQHKFTSKELLGTYISQLQAQQANDEIIANFFADAELPAPPVQPAKSSSTARVYSIMDLHPDDDLAYRQPVIPLSPPAEFDTWGFDQPLVCTPINGDDHDLFYGDTNPVPFNPSSPKW